MQVSETRLWPIFSSVTSVTYATTQKVEKRGGRDENARDIRCMQVQLKRRQRSQGR